MKFNNSLENYPSPIIAINDQNFVIAKNYLASMAFPNVHVGAKASNYTNIELDYETLSKGSFYGKKYTYYTCKSVIENEPCMLLFISLSSFGEDLLPFNLIELYKEKVLNESNNESPNVKNKQRRYIRSINNNLIKVNYFDNFRALFEANARPIDKNDTVELTAVYSTIEQIVRNYLGEIEITVNHNLIGERLTAFISEINIASILLNSLCFSVINSSGEINLNLERQDDVAEIKIEFSSNTDLFELYNINKNDVSNSALNSGFALLIALEIAKHNNIDFSISVKREGNKTAYTIKHIMPVKTEYGLVFSSNTSLISIFTYELLNIFFDED